MRDVPWLYLIVFVIVSLTIGIVGGLYYREQKEAIEQEKKKELETIADLKVQGIVNWRNERYADAITIFQNRLAANAIQKWFDHPADRRDEEEILNWLKSKGERSQYKQGYLFDRSGTLRLTTGADGSELGPHIRTDVDEALRKKQVIFGDFEKDTEEFNTHLDVIIPLLLIHDGDTLSVAAVVLQIDPKEFFFPFLNSIPLSSTTCEAMLVRQERDSIVYINGTKDNKHPPFSLHFPIAQSQLVAAMSLKGQEGVAEGRDYAGIPVLAAIRKVPNSPWNIAVKINIEEVYAPIRDLESATEIVVVLLIITCAAFVGMLWRHGRAMFYRRQYTLEVERKALMEHYDYATKYANDIILMADQEGRVVDINERGMLAYGYARDEIRGLSMGDIRDKDIALPIEETEGNKGDGFLYETRHRRKDGTSFPVEVSARIITIENRIFHQSIVRDITERKQAEEKLKSLNSLYYMLSQINQSIVHATDRSQLFQDVCNISVKFGGFRMAWIGMIDAISQVVIPVVQSGLDDNFLSLINNTLRSISFDHPIGKVFMEGERYVCNDFDKDPFEWPWRNEASKRGYRSFAVFPIRLRSRTVGTFAVNSSNVDFFDQDKLELLDEIAMDISFAMENIEKEKERKLAEEALQESTFWMRESQKGGRIGSYATDFTVGVWKSSEVLDEIFGIDKDFARTVEGWTKIIHPEAQEEMVRYLDKIIAQKAPFDKEYRIIRVSDGEGTMGLRAGGTCLCADGSLLKMFGTIQDITERKKSEELIALHSHALESAANAIVITDREGKIISVNPAFSRFTGYSASEVIGRTPKILNSGTQPSSFYKNLWETITSGRVWRGEIVNRRKDGSLYDEEMTITPVRDAAGQISYYIAIKQDVTEKKNLHAELTQMQKMESIGTLASGIAHDFNNILGIILGYASLIERDPETSAQSIASITAAVNRGAGLVRQILTFARKAGVVFGPLEVNIMIKEIVKMLRETFPKTVEISLRLGKNIPPVNADATQLHQTILNLCVNAQGCDAERRKSNIGHRCC